MISTRWRSPAESSPTSRVGVERQAVFLADLADARAPARARRRVLHAERHVLGDVERLEEREVLEHHRHARRARASCGAAGAKGVAVQVHLRRHRGATRP